MGQYHTVAEGDCVTSLADSAGLFWETIWNAPENADLKTKRKDGNSLAVGDQLFIPDLRKKQVPAAIDAQHKYKRRGVPAKLAIRLRFGDGRPRPNTKFILVVEGTTTNGTSDGDGFIRQTIPCNARQGTLTIPSTDPEEPDETFTLQLGELAPHDDIKGIQARLCNLGVTDIEVDGQLSPKTKAAIEALQRSFDLPATGEPDEAMMAKLMELHGS